MSINRIDAKTLQKLFVAGTKALEAKRDFVNELNVFPVPDGDTGTNMSLTILSAAKEVSQLTTIDMKSIAKGISSGSLRGARGNSGVILSQLFRGFSKEISDVEFIDTTVMANAFQKGVETAYKAVMKPKEGTILTVAKAAAEKALQLAVDSDDIEYVLRESILYAEEVLSKTPDMLPVLKEAGVVDAGGQGLVYVLKGAYDALIGKAPSDEVVFTPAKPVEKDFVSHTEDIKFGYCTEFIINLSERRTDEIEIGLKEYLDNIGDSIVVVADDEIIKVHVHTDDPGLALQKGLELGALTNIKIDNMREQHEHRVIGDSSQSAGETSEKVSELVPRKEIGFIVVSIGEGLNEIFKGLGVDYIIEGGQTMNPSTEDMLNAIDQVAAEHIFILPNNKNIILAAEQAKELVEDKEIIVIPTTSIPQGITTIINFEHTKSAEENRQKMIQSIDWVKTGQLTYAVRDTVIDGKEINQGDLLGIGDGEILVVGHDLTQSAKDLIDALVDEDSELISVYYGQDVSKESVEVLKDYIENTYDACDLEVHYGGQPLYYYILSVE